MRRMSFLASVLFFIFLALVTFLPSAPVSAQEEETPGPKAILTLQEDIFGNETNESLNSCSIDCGDGRTFETDAGTVIGCACDCASVCGGTCEATDGRETRTCSAT